MSRLGKVPIAIPKDVKVTVDGRTVRVEGKKGKRALTMVSTVGVTVEKERVVVTRTEDTKRARAMHGTTRAHLANMVRGVNEGFEKTLEINGSGYAAKVAGTALQLNIGFTHPVILPIPEGLTIECPNPNSVAVRGADRHMVGQFAANVRRVRPVEPYQLKGIKYRGEFIKKKAGKAAVGATK
jgi:large subunit ribosomal protein L6